MALLRSRAAALALPLLLAACAGNPGLGTAGSADDGTTVVLVKNNNWSDMVIYALRDGTRFRIGRVPSLSTARLELPRTLVGLGGDLQLAADPVGAERAFRTGPIHVQPGQLVEFTVQNHLQISYFSVWDR